MSQRQAEGREIYLQHEEISNDMGKGKNECKRTWANLTELNKSDDPQRQAPILKREMRILALAFVVWTGYTFEQVKVMVLFKAWQRGHARHPHRARLARHVLVSAYEDNFMVVCSVLPGYPDKVFAREVCAWKNKPE